MPRVLVTGIGGAIGTHMLAHLMHNTDWDIVGLDSFRHKGYTCRISELLQAHPDWAPRLEILTHDLSAPLDNPTKRMIGEVDYCINLASLSDVYASIEEPANFIENNVSIMVNMMEWAREKDGLKAFLHFSTDEVYGPTAGDSGGHKEWDTLLPSNPYSASKACQEMIGVSYWRSFGVPLVITNTMNNFGEMQAPSKYPSMVQEKVLAGEKVEVHVSSDGEIGSRYYLHSRNAADATLFILQNTTPHLHTPGSFDRPDRYNIVGDLQLDNLELAKVIARLLGRDLDYELVDFHSDQPGHDLHYGLDGTKLSELGWEPPVSFEESLLNTINWTIEHPEWRL
mgnify:CR=1 FL=1